MVIGRRLLAACAVLALAACRSDPPPSADSFPEATTPSSIQETTTTPTTLALGQQVNTVEAVQRLLDLFARIDGDAARMLVAKGAPDSEFDQLLQSVYVGLELELARERFAREARGKFKGYVSPPPNSGFTAFSIFDARRNDCVIVRGTASLQPRYTNPVPTIDGVFLMVVQTGITATAANPTRWRLLALGDAPADGDLEAICPAL